MPTDFLPAAPPAKGFVQYIACARCGVLRPPDKLRKSFRTLREEVSEVLICVSEQPSPSGGCGPTRARSHFDPPCATCGVFGSHSATDCIATSKARKTDHNDVLQVCTTCRQALPHAAACGATIDPELLGAP